MIKAQLEDTFEKLAEQGVSQAKKAVKSAAQQAASAVSVKNMWDQLLGASTATEAVEEQSGKPASIEKGKGNHTPLNVEKLAKQYQKSDQQKEIDLKNRLFQLVKQGEEKLITDRKQEEMTKKRNEEYDKQMKKRREEEKRQQEAIDLPKGKVRRNIFSPKKVAERQHSETKPATGKQ